MPLGFVDIRSVSGNLVTDARAAHVDGLGKAALHHSTRLPAVDLADRANPR